jgi:hypothetical protein
MQCDGFHEGKGYAIGSLSCGQASHDGVKMGNHTFRDGKDYAKGPLSLLENLSPHLLGRGEFWENLKNQSQILYQRPLNRVLQYA